jgi:hypothetical protein
MIEFITSGRYHITLRTVLTVICVTTAGLQADESTWTAKPNLLQLGEDPQLLREGKGFLFVPAMSVPRGNEPSYQVFHEGKKVAAENPGRGVLLKPGTYKVLIGSGAISQMMSKTVEVFEGQTSLLTPDWSALVVDVIDESRTSIKESYELYQEGTQENFGLGFGVEEERGEGVGTWILKPGVYHVVNVGESFSTIRKLSVNLEPGKLVQRNLVFDPAENRFIGFYQRPVSQYGAAQQRRALNSQTELSGSVLGNTTQRTAQDRTSLSLSVQMFNRTQYKSNKNFASLRFVFEEGATKEEGSSFRKSIDKLEVRGTYIYKVSNKFGPYLRGVMNTKLFTDDVFFDTPREFIKRNPAGDILSTEPNTSEVTLSPSFFPLRLRQGVGINSELFNTFPLNMDVRIGLGARQTFVSDSFELAGNDSSAIELANVSSTGIEALLITDARLAKAINFDSEFDILIPSTDPKEWVFTWENRLRIFLTSFVNLDIVADLEREETLNRLQGREQILLRFSRFF